MTLIEKARLLRAKIEELAFNYIEDSEAQDYADLFQVWDGEGHVYAVDDRFRYEGYVYRVLQDHVSQPQWTPDVTPSLYARVLIPDPGDIPEWEQPGSTNPYMRGDKVRHNGSVWVSDIDNNVWEPGVFGWAEQP